MKATPFRAALVIGLSVAAHAGMLAAARPRVTVRPALARSGHLAERAARLALPVSVAAARRELVARARADRDAGKLRVGEFLLSAGAIDAREEGRAFDVERARALWEERLGRLRGARDLRRDVPAVFGDLHYYGRTGRSMGDALLEGGGACEPLAHLIAAAIHDTGHPDRARMRFYGGGNAGGVTHIAPVLPDGKDEWDLLTGGAAQRSGATLSAEDLVEVYARAHGLAEHAPVAAHGAGGGGEGGSGAEAAAPSSTLADGYPANADHYAGSTPLFAGRAVQAPAEARTKPAVLVPAQAADCSFFVHMAALDPPTIQVGSAQVELRRVPTATQLERTFAILAAVEGDLEKRGPEPSADRLLDLACLTALYDDAATDLALTSDVELSRLSAEKRKWYADEGAKLLAGIDWDSPAGRAMLAGLASPGRGAERSWIVLVLHGGEAPLLRLATTAGKYDWGRVTMLAALVAAPATRARALTLIGALPKNAQIDAMHEIFRTHDHLRPWASNYVLDDAGDGEVARAYRVFRALAWGLWEGGRPQEEVLASLLRDSSAAHLDRAWVVGLLEYYGRNMLALHHPRDDAQEMAAGLARWLGAHGYTDAEVYELALEAARGPD